MKKILLTLFGIGLFGTLQMRADERTELTQKQLDWLKAGTADSILAHSNAQLRAQMPAAALSQLWQGITQQAGALKSQGEWSTTQSGGYEVRQCLLTFERAVFLYQVTFDKDGLFAGFFLRPAPAQPTTEMKTSNEATYTDNEHFTEKAFTVKNGDIALPGRLCMPKAGNGKAPAVVLVHGSGPCDMDETIGPNKFFKDLAYALAAKGIAVLRYDKRTHAYASQPEVMASWKLTYDTECTDDAVQALQQLSATEGIDASRIYICGHSLGGTLAPRIAANASVRPAGIVFLAAMAHPFWKTVREQLVYIATLQGSSDVAAEQEADSQIEKMKSTLPAEYLAMQDSYDALTTARKLGEMPMLFIQGGNDYQVTQEDLFTWSSAVDGNANAKFVFFEKLDHILRELDHKAVPTDYANVGKISDEALQSIAEFVLSKH